MQELASVRRFLDGLCSGSKNDSASAAPLLRLIRRVDISPGSVSILLDRNTFAACLSMGPERIREDALRVVFYIESRRFLIRDSPRPATTYEQKTGGADGVKGA